MSGCSGLDYAAIKNSFLFYKTITSQYRDAKVLEHVRHLVPGHVFDGPLVPEVLKWFKGFMTWLPNQIACERCSTGENKKLMVSSILPGSTWQVRKIEVHQCPNCGEKKTFPRYSDVLRIAESRYGRCGEWSILFGAILASLSVESRLAHDYLDHCWNEVLLDGNWYHTDSTFQYPQSFDNPLYYESNWNKKYVYIIAFSHDKIDDVTARYSRDISAVIQRRKSLGMCDGIDLGSVSDLQGLYSSTKSLLT